MGVYSMNVFVDDTVAWPVLICSGRCCDCYERLNIAELGLLRSLMQILLDLVKL